MLGEHGRRWLVETGETGMVGQGGVVVVKKVRKTGVWMERGGVLRRRVQTEGVRAWVGVGAGVCV